MIQQLNEAARKKFYDFMAKKKLRITSQRRAIVDSVFSTTRHFTAEELLAWSRQRNRLVSRATVYRTLPLLTESGLVREMDFGREFKYYDPNYADHPDHNHIICEDCNQIIEFENTRLKKLEDEITRKLGFSVKSQQLQIAANCEELKRRGICKNKEKEASESSLPPAIS